MRHIHGETLRAEPETGSPARADEPARPTQAALKARGAGRARQDVRRESAATTAARLGLRYVTTADLAIRRERRGAAFVYCAADGTRIRDKATVARLNRLAVPPAYRDVLCAGDPAAHLQAIGRDAAGRLQYRYHPEWEKVRELRKGRRIARLADALPRIRRSVARHLRLREPTHSFTAAAVIELVARTAIRAGDESYLRERRTRGAATLLKSNVVTARSRIALHFRSKGGRVVSKEVEAPHLARAIRRLCRLPGARLFQYRTAEGEIRPMTAREVNAFLREVAGVPVSLKDFRTLVACESVLEQLTQTEPAESARERRRQVVEAVRVAAEGLANTPAICRRSYVHDAIVDAFTRGALDRAAATLKDGGSKNGRARLLAEIIRNAG